jgi:hypothetical protein
MNYFTDDFGDGCLFDMYATMPRLELLGILTVVGAFGSF